jgi:hypothetical protein
LTPFVLVFVRGVSSGLLAVGFATGAVIMPEFVRHDVANDSASMEPLVLVRKSFGEDVSTHLVSGTVLCGELSGLVGLVEEGEVNPVSPAKVPESRGLACFNDAQGCSIVLHEPRSEFPPGQGLPQLETGQRLRPDGVVGGHDLSLGRRVRDAALTLGCG